MADEDEDEMTLGIESPTASEVSASIFPTREPERVPNNAPPSKQWNVEGVCELLDVRKRIDVILARSELEKDIAVDIQAAMMDMERLLHRERSRAEIAAVEHRLESNRLVSELDRYARRQTLESVQQRQMEEMQESTPRKSKGMR